MGKKLNAAQAAAMLGTHEKMIRKMIQDKILRAKKPGRDWQIEEADVQRLLTPKAVPSSLPDAPTSNSSLEDRLATLERQQAALLKRMETLERRLEEMAASNAPQRVLTPQQTALPLPETQEHRPPQKAISGPLPQGKPQRRHILLRVASEVLERHGGDARLLVVWGNLSADTGSVLRYASERGQTLHRCQVTGCACGEIIG